MGPCSRNGLSITSHENKSKPQKLESKTTNDKKLKESKETKMLERKLSVEPKSPSEHNKSKTLDNTEPEKPKALIAPNNDNTLTQESSTTPNKEMPISMVTPVVGNSIFDSESKQDPSIAEKKELISSTMKKAKVSQEAANLSRTKMVVSPIIPNDPWE